MTRNLAKLREHIKSTKQASTFVKDHALYPFFKLPKGSSTLMRLLPDGDETNQAPWATRKLIPLKFVDPDDDSKFVHYNVPCREMWLKKCPALQPVRDLYAQAKQAKAAGNTLENERLRKLAGAHWIDATSFHNLFVLKNGIAEENRPADLSPIRVVGFSKQVQEVIETSLGLVASKEGEEAPPSQFRDDELPCGTFSMDDVNNVLDGNVPDDEIEAVLAKFRGYPFLLMNRDSGDGHNSYKTSRFEMRDPHDLDVEMLNQIRQFGLSNLREKYFPKEPTDEQYETLTKMVKASIAGEPWNPEWTEAGFEFFRKFESSSSSSNGETSSGNSITDRVKANVAGAQTGGSSSLAAAMNRRKAMVKPEAPAVTEAPVEPEVVTVDPTTPVEPEVVAQPSAKQPEAKAEGDTKKDPKALAAFIKNKMKKS